MNKNDLTAYAPPKASCIKLETFNVVCEISQFDGPFDSYGEGSYDFGEDD